MAIIIKSHMGEEYRVLKKHEIKQADRSSIRTVYEISDSTHSQPADMRLVAGGYLSIKSDGTMTQGYNTFDASELKKAYDYLKGNTACQL